MSTIYFFIGRDCFVTEADTADVDDIITILKQDGAYNIYVAEA